MLRYLSQFWRRNHAKTLAYLTWKRLIQVNLVYILRVLKPFRAKLILPLQGHIPVRGRSVLHYLSACLSTRPYSSMCKQKTTKPPARWNHTCREASGTKQVCQSPLAIHPTTFREHTTWYWATAFYFLARSWRIKWLKQKLCKNIDPYNMSAPKRSMVGLLIAELFRSSHGCEHFVNFDNFILGCYSIRVLASLPDDRHFTNAPSATCINLK